MPKSPLRTHMKEEIQTRLYETALELFRRQGYENTTVEQITTHAGTAKGTFFNYFPTKDAVLAQFYRRETEKVLVRLREKDFETSREAILTLGNALTDLAKEEPHLFGSLGKVKLSSASLTSEEQLLDSEIRQFCVETLAGSNANEPAYVIPDPGIAADVILSIITATTHEWRLANTKFPLREKVSERLNFLFRMFEKQDRIP